MSVKTIKFSNRPWRYERCIVFEEDLDITRDDLKGFANPPRIPHRVVMNNHTFTVFENFDYQTVQYSIPLKYLEVKDADKEPDCMIVVNKVTKWE